MWNKTLSQLSEVSPEKSIQTKSTFPEYLKPYHIYIFQDKNVKLAVDILLNPQNFWVGNFDEKIAYLIPLKYIFLNNIGMTVSTDSTSSLDISSASELSSKHWTSSKQNSNL